MDDDDAAPGVELFFLITEISGKRHIISRRAYRDMLREKQKVLRVFIQS